MKASLGIALEAAKGTFDDASVSLGRIDGLVKTTCGEIERVPTTVEHLSRVDDILPPDNCFDAEASKDALSIEAEIIDEICQSVVHLRTRFGMFKQLQVIDDGGKYENIFAENASAPVEEPAPASDSFVAGVDDTLAKSHGVSVDYENLANKHTSDIDCSDGLDQTEHKFSTGDGVFDGEQSKSTGGDTIISVPILEEVSTQAAL
ncbi:hypothetical protein ZWY2020_052552 [Hordeum vulgare]|nr:hypothetical protein ZWY2020_052552 [Hordeum vulgare]